MAKINKELLRIMDDYRLFMESEKKIECPVVVSKEKQNHRSSLYVEGPVSGDNHIDCVKYNCELRDKRIDNYSISLVTDCISKKMLFRLDQGNGTHRNNLSGIALEEQSVPTPHFHKYTDDGHDIAYQTQNLRDNSMVDIYDGFKLFCNEANIIGDEEQEISLVVYQDGVIPFEDEKDPLNGISF